MTEEEKEAKENLKKNRGVSFKEADVLSNLIEKQRKEIDYYKNQDKNKGKLLNKALNETKNECISKDKIREKIKELEKEAFKSIAISEKINILKELLEENNND